jgi:hypothetical protein
MSQMPQTLDLFSCVLGPTAQAGAAPSVPPGTWPGTPNPPTPDDGDTAILAAGRAPQALPSWDEA